MKFAVCVAWHNEVQRQLFLDAWGIKGAVPEWLVMEQDEAHLGCAVTKNRAIKRAIDMSADAIVVLDDDCYPEETKTLVELAQGHLAALEPQPCQLFEPVTDPSSRGTPYYARALTMPVAASMGFWSNFGDYDSPGQLIHGATHPMKMRRGTIFGRYFALCGMNYAFRAVEWPWCQLVESVGRFDDIWMGLLWQKHATASGQCFNLAGPIVRHSRQSNVWANLRDEAQRLEANETAWQRVHEAQTLDRDELLTIVKGAP